MLLLVAAYFIWKMCCYLDGFRTTIFFSLSFAEEKAEIEIVPIFISVDFERGTVEQVHEYVKGDSKDWNSIRKMHYL